jgi:hypothetical protein
MTNWELVFIQPPKPATLLRRFQLYIETSDWDEQIIREGPLIDKICLVMLILLSLTIFPFIVAALLKGWVLLKY